MSNKNPQHIRNNNEILLRHLRKYWIIIFRGENEKKEKGSFKSV